MWSSEGIKALSKKTSEGQKSFHKIALVGKAHGEDGLLLL